MEKGSFVPRYRAIYNDLKARIEKGQYPPGGQLPFERTLCEMYDVERITVRRALTMLVQEDLIEKRAGLGSFVKDRSPASRSHDVSATILFIMRSNQNDIRHNVTAFNALLYFTMEQACRERGYSLLYVGIQPEDDIQKIICAHNITGIMLISTLANPVIQQVIDSGIPAICVNHYDSRLLSILPDNEYGAYLAVDYLAKLGHKRIAYINGMPGATNAKERMSGYYRALHDNGLPIESALIADGHWTFDGGLAAMSGILNHLPQNQWPTAVFSGSDMMAIGAIDAIKKRGLSIPEDISIIGFDNISMCNYCSPKLTSIAADAKQLAVVAVDHLMRFSDQGVADTDCYTIRLPVSFVGRDSTMPREPVGQITE